LAERMRILLLDEKLRCEIGMKAADYARNYDWSIIAREVIAVYEKVISNHKSS